jgi:glycosyltransferase involved in cell wall biosynthesis
MHAPTVSVVVPTWNRAVLLAHAVASVQAQTFTDWELIVVDDCSTDDTAELLDRLAEPRLTVLRLAHGANPARARNAGIRVARGRDVMRFAVRRSPWRHTPGSDPVYMSPSRRVHQSAPAPSRRS